MAGRSSGRPRLARVAVAAGLASSSLAPTASSGALGPLGPSGPTGPTWLALSRAALFAAGALVGSGPSQAEVYRSPEAFVAAAGGQPDQPSHLLQPRDLQHEVREILGHSYKALRIRYWRAGEATIWVLKEIGKEEDITIGFVIRDRAIVTTEVLEFREPQGWQIRFPAFTRRFEGARLADHNQLDREIDGLTGATLSVRAYRGLARLALLFDGRVNASPAAESPSK